MHDITKTAMEVKIDAKFSSCVWVCRSVGLWVLECVLENLWEPKLTMLMKMKVVSMSYMMGTQVGLGRTQYQPVGPKIKLCVDL